MQRHLTQAPLVLHADSLKDELLRAFEYLPIIYDTVDSTCTYVLAPLNVNFVGSIKG